ncbi:MAG: helix-turn-helix transcriptional regulator [Vibrio sp.]|uniref:helix-turn-helix transcriptional regulator n=1 Tax=Vibrio TaxID=662 RepID=UPI001EB5CBC8|nr:helix-turn-helix transcriptional regulator [Vibrio sp.]NRB68958.1 helix-turn-helix transcriptional regulator [Vibrio sp.]
MNKIRFYKHLKSLRQKHSLSQEQLALSLSSSHRSFSGVNQAMISQWEAGKRKPSLVRRLGIASFFQTSYEFSLEELKHAKPVENQINRIYNSSYIYNYQITSIESSNLNDTPLERLSLIESLHIKTSVYDMQFLIDKFSIDRNDIMVICFLSENLLIGHFIYDKKKNIFISWGAISNTIKVIVFDYICNKMFSKICIIPIVDPIMGQFLYDLYYSPCCNDLNIKYFKLHLEGLIKNPFVQSIISTNDMYFKYISYYSLHQKKSTIEQKFKK